MTLSSEKLDELPLAYYCEHGNGSIEVVLWKDAADRYAALGYVVTPLIAEVKAARAATPTEPGEAVPVAWVLVHPQHGERLSQAPITDGDRSLGWVDTPLVASPPAQLGVTEACANVAKEWLQNWAADLMATAESYIEARTTGKHNGRRIDPENAKMFAGQFRERAEAVAGCADHVAEAILNSISPPYKGETEPDVQFRVQWTAAARPPTHPEPMNGRQTFATRDHCVNFLRSLAEDATLVSVTRIDSRSTDITSDFLPIPSRSADT